VEEEGGQTGAPLVPYETGASVNQQPARSRFAAEAEAQPVQARTQVTHHPVGDGGHFLVRPITQAVLPVEDRIYCMQQTVRCRFDRGGNGLERQESVPGLLAGTSNTTPVHPPISGGGRSQN
jgi:hypothetical protein